MQCCFENVIDGLPNGVVVSAATSSPSLLVIATTVSVTDNTPTDMFAGQAAPQASSMIVAADAVTIGGIRWDVWGTLLNASGGNLTITLTLLFNGTTIYSDTSQLIASNATPKPWRYAGSITRKSATTGFLGGQMFSMNQPAIGPTTGIGPLDSVGTVLSPATVHANDDADTAGLDWTSAQTLSMLVSWSAAGADRTFSISGGAIERFGS